MEQFIIRQLLQALMAPFSMEMDSAFFDRLSRIGLLWITYIIGTNSWFSHVDPVVDGWYWTISVPVPCEHMLIKKLN